MMRTICSYDFTHKIHTKQYTQFVHKILLTKYIQNDTHNLSIRFYSQNTYKIFMSYIIIINLNAI